MAIQIINLRSPAVCFFLASCLLSTAALEATELEESSGTEQSGKMESNGLKLTQMQLLPKLAKQGETVQILLRAQASADGSADSAALPVVQFRDRKFRAFKYPESGTDTDRVYRLFIAAPADLEPGVYKVRAGNLVEELKVVDGAFGVQVMRLPKGKDNFKSSPGEEEAVLAAKATVSPKQYWQGAFLAPSKARVSSAFGLRRRVNGKLLKDYFHSGLDFAGRAGSDVLASQNGKVILARTGWRLHGNTVSIDHGQGVVSFYIHLLRLCVKEGDIVKAGQKIGEIGATGRASGPHLHFSLYVNNDAASPWSWFKGKN